MTNPFAGFENVVPPNRMQVTEVDIEEAPQTLQEAGMDSKESFPKAIVALSEKARSELLTFLDERLEALISAQNDKLEEWKQLEELYRALPEAQDSYPFVGACKEQIPVIAMAVDPTVSRLEQAIFRTDPMFVLKPTKKSLRELADPVARFTGAYFKNVLGLRKVLRPRFIEHVLNGTMVLKTVYAEETYDVVGYDRAWKRTKKRVTRFKGPKVIGVPLKDFYFDPGYEHLQDCPATAERQRVPFSALKIAESSGYLANVDAVKNERRDDRNILEHELEEGANHLSVSNEKLLITVYEMWVLFDIDGDGVDESLCVTYHYDTRTILQLRYNWYAHQRRPYTLIQYQRAKGTLYGLGMGEMTAPFQRMQTQWHRMATDNAQLANIRMWKRKKVGAIEQPENLKMFAGRQIWTTDPEDMQPLQLGDTYNSTLQERSNLLSLAQQRNGASEYLAGHESKVAGSRATATGTVALIQQGTIRVEHVVEGLREGFAEVLSNVLHIWKQYGLEGLDEDMLDYEDAEAVKKLLDSLDVGAVDSAFAVELGISDSSSNRSAMQQQQMALIQQMMGYYQQLLTAGQQAIVAAQQSPQSTQLIVDVMSSMRKMFHDMLVKYDTPDPDAYLPNLENALNGEPSAPAATSPNLSGGLGGGLGGPPGLPSFEAPPPAPGGPSGAMPPSLRDFLGNTGTPSFARGAGSLP